MPAAPDRARDSAATQLRESAFERVSSGIVTLLVAVGGLVAVLLVIWFSRVVYRSAAMAPPAKLGSGVGGDPLGVPGEVLHVEGPERDVIAKETDAIAPEIKETMEMVTSALAKQVADLDNPLFTKEPDGGPVGGHKGSSDRPSHGPPVGIGGGSPLWEMRYDETSLAIYAQQLDALGIELAVVGGSKNQLEYASSFSRGPIRRRTGSRDQEVKSRRTYFTHRSGTVQRYDQLLLSQAGINWQGQGRLILQYYSQEAEQQLLIVQERFRGLKQEQIQKTVFGIRKKGAGFEFFVVDQQKRF